MFWMRMRDEDEEDDDDDDDDDDYDHDDDNDRYQKYSEIIYQTSDISWVPFLCQQPTTHCQSNVLHPSVSSYLEWAAHLDRCSGGKPAEKPSGREIPIFNYSCCGLYLLRGLLLSCQHYPFLQVASPLLSNLSPNAPVRTALMKPLAALDRGVLACSAIVNLNHGFPCVSIN